MSAISSSLISNFQMSLQAQFSSDAVQQGRRTRALRGYATGGGDRPEACAGMFGADAEVSIRGDGEWVTAEERDQQPREQGARRGPRDSWRPRQRLLDVFG